MHRELYNDVTVHKFNWSICSHKFKSLPKFKLAHLFQGCTTFLGRGPGPKCIFFSALDRGPQTKLWSELSKL